VGRDGVNLGLSFLRGLVASVNPCAFVLLPTYLMYFLGVEAGRGGPVRASMQRALTVAVAVSSGFMLVFVVAGVISNFFTSWLDRNAKYATAGIGVGLILLGAAMLFGYRLPWTTPSVSGAGRGRTVRSMFVYGLAYAVCSLSCTIGLFAATAFAAPDSFGEGVANVVAFGLGMTLIVTALTVSLAFANHALLGALRSATRYVDTVAAAFVLLSGVYLIRYFWVVDVNEDTDAATSAVERLQNWILVRLNDNWQVVAVALAAVVIAAVAFVTLRRGSEDAVEVPSPVRDPAPH
jgi:cytochrome c-type biogenesis protein